MKKNIDHYVYLTSGEAMKYTKEAIREGVLPDLSGEKCELGWKCAKAVYEDGTKAKLDNATCWHHKSYKMGVSKDGEYLWRETLQGRDNMLALCDHCHAKLHMEADKNPDKYSDLCPTFDEFVKARNLIFFDAENPPREDLMSIKQTVHFFNMAWGYAVGIPEELRENGFNTYKQRHKNGGESRRCKTFYSKSDLLKCGFEQPEWYADYLKEQREAAKEPLWSAGSFSAKNDELKKTIAIKDETIRSQEKHIDKLCGIIDEYRAILELPLPDQAGA